MLPISSEGGGAGGQGGTLKRSVLQLSLVLQRGPPRLQHGAKGKDHHLGYRMDTVIQEREREGKHKERVGGGGD